MVIYERHFSRKARTGVRWSFSSKKPIHRIIGIGIFFLVGVVMLWITLFSPVGIFGYFKAKIPSDSEFACLKNGQDSFSTLECVSAEYDKSNCTDKHRLRVIDDPRSGISPISVSGAQFSDCLSVNLDESNIHDLHWYDAEGNYLSL